MPEYRNWSISLGRRFRALKLWFVLRLYGLKNIRNLLRLHFDLAKKFEQLLTTDGRFEIVNDVQFGLVCFRLKHNNELTKKLHENLLNKGEVYLVLSSYHENAGQELGQMNTTISYQTTTTTTVFLRFVSIHGTTMKDIDYAYQKIASCATEIIDQFNE
ncbi:unnamed protein product [Schistosoma mattheei]|nr:unnamed protein product [Schistosoma mattheei]